MTSHVRLATAAQSAELDRTSPVPVELLMEAAGTLAADRVAREAKVGPITVLCGPGHNGADGLVIARHLRARGRDVRLHLAGESRAELHRAQLARLGFAPGPLTFEGTLVDALFGVGLRGPLAGEFKALVDRVNAAPIKRIAIDVPSGLDADRGLGPAVRADLTLTFGPAKPGLFINEGPAFAGRIKVLNIGLAPDLLARAADTHRLFTAREVRLPFRHAGANKTRHGRVVVAAGRPDGWGAGLLAAEAAFRVGAGYVTWASFEKPDRALKRIPEMLTARLDDAGAWAKASAVCLGPGLGVGDTTARLIEKLKTRACPVVLDADGITTAAQHRLWPLPANWILTPHAGELARVLGRAAEEIERDRFAAVRDAAAVTGCLILLKGFRTVVGDEHSFDVIHAGNVALAKAGSGDVLAGAIAGLMAQGLATREAACLGAFLHGRVADDWVAEGRAPHGLRANDLLERLPLTMGTY